MSELHDTLVAASLALTVLVFALDALLAWRSRP